MEQKSFIKISGPRCPMCHSLLEGCGFPLPKKGVGRCPAGMIDFEFELDLSETEEEKKKDKFGNIIKEKSWKITGDASNHKVEEVE